MNYFTPEQWIVVGLVFVLGFVVGMILMTGGRWKRRWRQETLRTAELEADNRRLRREVAELGSFRNAAAKEAAAARSRATG